MSRPIDEHCIGPVEGQDTQREASDTAPVRPAGAARCFYSASFDDFGSASELAILGEMVRRNPFELTTEQRDTWLEQVSLLRDATRGRSGWIILEYTIPRVGRRADAILLLGSVVVVVEFKLGEQCVTRASKDQALDYALDLKNFHAASHDARIVPIVVARAAPGPLPALEWYTDGVARPIGTATHGLGPWLHQLDLGRSAPTIDLMAWLESPYHPTPTIIEAAQALDAGHDVGEISRSDAGAHNLTTTAAAITSLIERSRASRRKTICFVTGVPGAGKTLAGLNIANRWHDPTSEEHAVFLSGNGPLVTVLREALTRDKRVRDALAGRTSRRQEAAAEVKAFIQNVHHFRDDCLSSSRPPVERVVLFDEAQRAWNREQTAKFMARKRNQAGFAMSEPEFLISAIDRHQDWAVVVCLVGGGQEIHTGEAGIAEWLRAVRDSFPAWRVALSNRMVGPEYGDSEVGGILDDLTDLERNPDLHLGVSVRSFRSEQVSAFVKAVLDGDVEAARRLNGAIASRFPFVMTRDLDRARLWLRSRARGSERIGLLASSSGHRLKPCGINVRYEVDPCHWFLNGPEDVRSSSSLEDAATEFMVQGLELDWTCVAWDADLRRSPSDWSHHVFRGTRWQSVRDPESRRNLKNSYRVLLTRARQGCIVFIPRGDADDPARPPEFYDPIADYISSIGVPEI